MLAMQRQMSRAFLVLMSLPSSAMGFALSVQIAALSWILSTRYHLHLEEIGVVWAAGPVAGIVGQLLIGVISDSVWFWGGRRRPFIVIGGALASMMLLALPNIGLVSRALGLDALLGVAIGVALALDLSINVSFNPTRSIITDLTTEGAPRTRGYTWMQTVSGSFAVLAYGIGSQLGNDVLIYVAVVLVALGSIVPALLIVEPRRLPGAAPASGSAGGAHGALGILRILMPLWGYLAYDLVATGCKLAGIALPARATGIAVLAATALLTAMTLTARDRGAEFVKEDLVEFRKVLAAHALSWIGVQTMFVYMIGFVQQRFPALGADASGRLLSTAFLTLTVVSAAMPALVLEPLTERFGQVAVHAACLGVMALAYAAIYALGDSTVVLFALMGVVGVGWAAIVSLPFAIMSQRVEQSRIGLYMGVFNLSVVLPQLLVSLGVGPIVDRLADKGVMFLISAGALALSALAWVFVRRGDGAAAGLAPGHGH